MPKVQTKSKRKLTGGLYKKLRKKKKRDFGKDFFPIRIGEKKKKVVRGIAKKTKQRLLRVQEVNVFSSSSKPKKVKILNVKENPANPHFVRMGVITKGAIIETELGLARVVSRPGQHGVVNAHLIEEK
jgi:small subunit ribosomal protein S8e